MYIGRSRGVVAPVWVLVRSNFMRANVSLSNRLYNTPRVLGRKDTAKMISIPLLVVFFGGQSPALNRAAACGMSVWHRTTAPRPNWWHKQLRRFNRGKHGQSAQFPIGQYKHTHTHTQFDRTPLTDSRWQVL